MLHLRENTRDLHEAIEAQVARLGAFDGGAGHRAHLARPHGVHAPLEPALDALLVEGNTVPDLAERRKTRTRAHGWIGAGEAGP